MWVLKDLGTFECPSHGRFCRPFSDDCRVKSSSCVGAFLLFRLRTDITKEEQMSVTFQSFVILRRDLGGIECSIPSPQKTCNMHHMVFPLQTVTVRKKRKNRIYLHIIRCIVPPTKRVAILLCHKIYIELLFSIKEMVTTCLSKSFLSASSV